MSRLSPHFFLICLLGASTAAAEVSLTAVPLARPDYVSTLPGQAVMSVPVLENDTVPQGGTRTVLAFTQGLKGTVAGNPDGTLRYTPNAGFTAGQDRFTYTLSDGLGGQATGGVQVSTGLLHAGPWPMMGRNPARTGYHPGSLSGRTLTEAWTLKMASDRMGQVAIGAGKVFVSSGGGIGTSPAAISVLELASGAYLWKKDFPPSYTASSPVYGNGTVYIAHSYGGGVSGDMVALDAEDGSTQWNTGYAAQGVNILSPALTDTAIYLFGGYSGGLFAYNRNTGARMFATNPLGNEHVWAPAVAQNKVYTFIGNLFRQHDPQTGSIDGSVYVPWSDYGAMNRTVAIADGCAYLVTHQGDNSSLLCMDLATRTPRWTVGTKFTGTPSVAGSRVYAVTYDGEIKAYDKTTGSLMQTYPTGVATSGFHQLIITDDVLIVTGSMVQVVTGGIVQKYVTIIHALDTGAKLQTLPAGGIPSLSDGRLLLAGMDGVLCCYRVAETNTAPVATASAVTCVEDQSVVISLTGTDADGDVLRPHVSTLPVKGTLHQTTAEGLAGEAITSVPVMVTDPGHRVIYRPNADGFGQGYDAFQFKVNDGQANSAAATITLHVTNVNDAPVAIDDVVHLRAGDTLPRYLPTMNDVDADGDPLPVIAFTSPARGSLTQNADGSLRYVPGADFTEGTDSFQYTLQDSGGVTASATVQVRVSTAYGKAWTQLGNGADHPGSYPVALGTAPWVLRWETAQPDALNPLAVAGGRVFLTPQGSYKKKLDIAALDCATGGEVWHAQLDESSYMNPPSYHKGIVYMQRCNNASDSQVWALDAADGRVRWAAPYLSQWDRHDSPAVSDLGVYVNGGEYGGIYGFDHLTGTRKFFRGLSQVSGWAPALHQGKLYSAVHGVVRNHDLETGVTLASTTLTSGYYPHGETLCCAEGRAYLTDPDPQGWSLACVDLPAQKIVWRLRGNYQGTPAIHNGVVYARHGGMVKAHNSTTGQWIADYKPAGESSFTGPPVVTHDLLFISSSAKTYIFDLKTRSILQTLNFGSQVAIADDVLYLACTDKKVRAFGRPVPDNTAPVAHAEQLDIQEEDVIALMLEGTDADGTVPRYVVRSLPASGTLYQTDGISVWPITHVPAQVFNPAGILFYEAAPDAQGTGVGSFTFTAHDAVAASAAATVTINIAPVNDGPLAIEDVVALRPGVRLLGFHPEANDRDVDGDGLSVVAFTQGSHGQVTQNADGSLNYAAAGIASGTDTFGYTVRDAGGQESSSSVKVTVSATLGRAWPTLGGGPDHASYQPVPLGTAPLELLWQQNLPAASTQPAIAEGRIYACLDTAKRVVALDQATGMERWSSAFPSQGRVNPVTWFDGTVFVQNTNSSANRLHALNAATGAARWQAPFLSQRSTWAGFMAPVADAGGVYMAGGTYGGMYGYQPQNGAQMFFFDGMDDFYEWTPTLYAGGLYSFVNGLFLSHHKTTGAVLWGLDLDGTGPSSYVMHRIIACADGHAYVINNPVPAPFNEEEVICIRLATREVVWRVRGQFLGNPALGPGAVHVITDGNTVQSYDAGTGKPFRTCHLPETLTAIATQPIATPDTLLVASATKTYLFNVGDGSLRQTLPVGGQISLAGETLCIASASGTVSTYGWPNPPNIAPVAVDMTATGPEDTPLPLTLQGLDTDGDAFSFSLTTLPESGTLHQTADGITPAAAITQVPAPVTHPGGRLIYMPPAHQHGAPLARFQFITHDGTDSSLAATVTLNIQSVPDAPVAQNDTRQAESGQVLSPLREQNNDFDPDGDPITLVTFTQPAHGRVIQNGDGTLRYQAPAHLATGTDSFTYTLRDNTARTGTATVTVIIGPFTPPPSPDDPVITPPGGTFDQPVQVTLGTALPGMIIHYTLDGRAPNPDSPSFAAGTTVTLHQSALLRIISVKGSEISSIRQAAFAFTDSDGDDLTDSWEMQHFSSRDFASNLTDSDLDGMSDLHEFLAGTDPRSAADRFAATVSTGPDGAVTLLWPSKSGFSYVVETSTDLVHWRSENASASIAGDGSAKVHPLSSGNKRRAFVRVRVQPDLTGP